MEQWQKSLENALTDASELAKRFDLSEEAVRRVSAVFPFRITRYYLSLIRSKAIRSTASACPTSWSFRRAAT